MRRTLRRGWHLINGHSAISCLCIFLGRKSFKAWWRLHNLYPPWSTIKFTKPYHIQYFMTPLLEVGRDRPDFLMRKMRLSVHTEVPNLPQEDEVLIHPSSPHSGNNLSEKSYKQQEKKQDHRALPQSVFMPLVHTNRRQSRRRKSNTRDGEAGVQFSFLLA